MVQVTIRRDSRERLSSFFASGHAGWADSGQDVVCAAVSTLLQAAWLGLDEVAGIAVAGTREAGRLELSWPEAARADPGVSRRYASRIGESSTSVSFKSGITDRTHLSQVCGAAPVAPPS